MRSLRQSTSLTLLMPLLAMVACSHTIPQAATKPQPPPQLGKTPPVIEPLKAGQKQAEAPESMLPVTLTADLTQVQKSIEAALPERVTSEGHPLGGDYQWRFVREGEPEVQIQDGLVKYQALYRGEIESSAARACRLDPLYPIIEGTGRLQLREDNQGLLVTMTDSRTSMSLKPESDTKCNMFNMPVQDQLAELFQQDAMNQRIARAVEDAGHVIPLNQTWDQLQEPIAVRTGNTQLCLYGQARDFTIGSMKGAAQKTTITGFARQTPVALFQTPCQKPAKATPLTVHMDQAAAASMQEGQAYRILLSVPVPYAVVNQQLQERLFHQEVKLPTTFGNKLRIDRAVASESGGRTLMALDTSGDLNGTLYYWGTPHLERNGTLMTIPDLQMAHESRLALDEVKTGYWQMVDQELKGRLKEAVQIDIAQRIGNMKNALSGQHTAGGLNLDLLVARQEGVHVTSNKEALVADILLEGTATATSRLPVTQQVKRDDRDRQPQAEKVPSRAARVPEDQPNESTPDRR